MELDELRVRNYRCIEDSGWVSVDRFTTLIGRNESGKTGFMKAVERLNAAYSVEGYDPYEDYPRDEWPEYRDHHEEDPEVVVSARFDLDEEDHAAIESAFGRALLDGSTATVHRDYGDELSWDLAIDESACIDHIRAEHEIPDELSARLKEIESLSERSEDASGATDGLRSELKAELGGEPTDVLTNEIGTEALEERLPQFRYIGEYAIMDGTIEIDALLERRENDELTASDRVFLSLLSVAGLELEEFQEVDDWRRRTAELENASASVTEEAMAYWGQSGDIQIRINSTTTNDGNRVLDVRIENRDLDVTVEFEQRSHGFRRFFSNFCQLTDMKQRDEDLVLLLDEPGLNLHARAKQEFRTFITEELAGEHPLIYTTHSPFMIDPETVHRTYMVRSDAVGETNVFTDVTEADPYTRFPLRNVFEFDLMDTLLVRPGTLLVEKKADHVYLYVVSKLLEDLDKTGLDPRWTVIPITNASNIGTFGSLFGEDQLEVAALLSEAPRAGLRPNDESAVQIREVREYADTTGDSTLEDILSESFFIEIVNRAYATEIDETDGVPDRLTAEALAQTDPGSPIVERVRSYFRSHDINHGEFDRDQVALCMQENREELAEELDPESRRSFTRLFTDLNRTLESFEGIDSRERSILGSLFG